MLESASKVSYSEFQCFLPLAPLGEIRKGVKTAKNMTFFVAEIMKHNAAGRQAL